MNRRRFLLGAGALVAAPAVLRLGLHMPVRKIIQPASIGEVLLRYPVGSRVRIASIDIASIDIQVPGWLPQPTIAMVVGVNKESGLMNLDDGTQVYLESPGVVRVRDIMRNYDEDHPP